MNIIKRKIAILSNVLSKEVTRFLHVKIYIQIVEELLQYKM